MSYAVQVNESSASRRVIYLWAVQSNGTSAATNEAGGRPLMSVGALSMWTTENTLSAVSANAGHYALVLGASDISLLGQGTILYSSGTALPVSVPVEIVGYNPFTAYSLFTSADSVGLKAQVHSGATVAGLVSDVSVRNGTYSAVTIGGVVQLGTPVTGTIAGDLVVLNGLQNLQTAFITGLLDQTNFSLTTGSPDDDAYNGMILVVSDLTDQTQRAVGRISDYTGSTRSATLEYDPGVFTISNGDLVFIKNPASVVPGLYSGVTVGTAGGTFTLQPGRYSDVTIGGVERVESSVTIADANYSAVTVRVGGIAPAVGATSGLSFLPAPGNYGSTVTVGVNNITPATGAISGLSFRPAPGAYSDVTVRVAGPIALTSAVTLAGGRYSDVTIGGVERVESSVTIANANYSAVTVRVGGGALSSAVTLAAGRYSDVTIGGVEALESAVTLAAGRYSDVTIGGVERLESGVTIDTGGIEAASFAAGAIDAVALATDAGQEIADRLLQRNIMGGSDSGRTVSEAFAALRNRVAIDGSTVTVYRENDTTAYWTASIATVSTDSGLISDLNPA